MELRGQLELASHRPRSALQGGGYVELFGCHFPPSIDQIRNQFQIQPDAPDPILDYLDHVYSILAC